MIKVSREEAIKHSVYYGIQFDKHYKFVRKNDMQTRVYCVSDGTIATEFWNDKKTLDTQTIRFYLKKKSNSHNYIRRN